jgi:hypothetical protein
MMAYLFGLFGPREANGMRQHDPRDLYVLGIVHRLLELKVGHRVSEYREILTQVSFILEQFIENKFNVRYVPNAVAAAKELRILTATFAKATRETDFVLDDGTLEQLLRKGLVGHFESSLSIDLKALPLFLIEDKRGYSSIAFQRDASVVFSAADIASMAPLTLDDIAEAGRCLLFDRHTAAGFHTMRAVEAVARGYYRMVFDAEPINTNNNQPLGLGAIAGFLQKYKTKRESSGLPTGALEDIISPLDRITRIYRNNIMHPEMTLDEDLAIDVFDSAKTVIATMLRDLRTGGSHFKVAWATYDFSWAWELED